MRKAATDDSGNTEERHESLHLTEVLFRSLASGVIAVDARQRITAFNPAAERITGLKAHDVLRKTFDALPAPLQGFLQETFVTCDSIPDRQMPVSHPQGGEILIRASTFAYTNDSGKIEAALLLFHDASSAKKLELNVRRLDRLANIGTLSASAAHEIKNALVAIKTFIERLPERLEDKELAGLVHSEVERIDSIASQLLKLSGPAKPVFTPVSVHKILDNSLRLIGHRLESNRVKLVRSFAAHEDLVHADDKQLGQAFINLFLNAIEAMSSGGTLQVATTPHSSEKGGGADYGPRWLRLTISDTGPGIPAEHLPQVFDRFFTTKQDGTGLGLAITRSIIQEHGGTITVESVLHKGTSFKIALPLAGPAA
jgi:two-component system, NtrC family, sensor histidine kinase HydH